MKEEIFGPILPILVVEDAESAIRFINKRSRPLAAYVFSRDHEVRLTFERQTSSGALGYSLPLGHLLSSRLPFGGVGASGIGTYHGKAGFLTFSHVKTVVTKPQFPDTLRLVYPPFNEAKAKLFDIIAKSIDSCTGPDFSVLVFDFESFSAYRDKTDAESIVRVLRKWRNSAVSYGREFQIFLYSRGSAVLVCEKEPKSATGTEKSGPVATSID